MKIKDFTSVANDTNEFQKKLRELNNEIQKSRDPYLYIQTIKKEFEKEYKKIIEFDGLEMSNTYYLSSANHFCIQIIYQFLKNMEDETDKEKYVKIVLEVFENCLRNYTSNTNVRLDGEFVEKTDIILSLFNLSIIEKLTNIKPHIFITEDTEHFAITNTFTMVLDQNLFFDEDAEVDVEKLFNILINLITECTLTVLFEKWNLEKMFEEIEEEDLKLQLGRSIATALAEHKMDENVEKLMKMC